jgi:hypothetical protein
LPFLLLRFIRKKPSAIEGVVVDAVTSSPVAGVTINFYDSQQTIA